MGDENKKHKKMYRKITFALISLLLITFTTAGAYEDNIVNDVKQILKIYYVDDLPASVYDKSTVSDILNEVNKNDPYTKYYTANKYKEFVNSIDNDSSGIGIYIEMNTEGAKVISVIDKTPEKASGIMVGDIILMVDNHITVGLSKDAVIRYLKGNGTVVALKVKRGSKLINININREGTSNYAIDADLLDKHIGYIKINSFAEYGDSQFGYLISDFEKKKVDSYIIDLRYDGGGFLTTAIDIAGYFIGNNVATIYNGKLAGKSKAYGKFHGMLINKPVIFLINKYSASASELLAAAVKDYKKAYFIGTTTHGKGCIQWSAYLSNNDVLKLTIARIYSPKGKPIDKVGVSPDLYLPDDVDSMRLAELMLDSNNYLKDNRGYVKIDFGDKTLVLKLSRAVDPLFWQSYMKLLDFAAKDGSVMFGNGAGWSEAPKRYLDNVAKMYFPSYREETKLTNVRIDSEFRIPFKTKMVNRSLNSKNIELIDIQTGNRVPVSFRTTDNRVVFVSPKDNLQYGKTYYLVIHPNILQSNNKPLGYGTINEIQVKKEM